MSGLGTKFKLRQCNREIEKGCLIVAADDVYLVCENSYNENYSLVSLTYNDLLEKEFKSLDTIDCYIEDQLGESIIKVISPSEYEIWEL